MWQRYQLILRVLAPTHIGWSKLGNVQRTRPYITGRALWGALTARLTRDRHEKPTASNYQDTGKCVHDHIALCYLYPAVQSNGCYQVLFPWEDTTPQSILSSYSGTALDPASSAADEGLLHEVEYIAPHTCDTGAPVYLVGYLFLNATSQATLPALHHALERLQVGGERGYGWGRLTLVDVSPMPPGTSWELFCNTYTPQLNHPRPRVTVPQGSCLLAHTIAEGSNAHGEIEPLVGREWAAESTGSHVAYNGICYAPGTQPRQQTTYEIGHYGIWYPVP